MTTAFDFSTIADEIAATQADANVASKGGGDYVPPPKGLARLRLIGYVELGKSIKTQGEGKGKTEDRAHLIFELSGKGFEPKEVGEGDKKVLIPHRITVKLNKSLNEKATYYKLFKRMNYEQKAKSFIQLLGQAYLGNVGHFEIPAKEAGGKPNIIANFRDDAGNLTIRPPRIETVDDEGEVVVKPIAVAAALSAQRCLVWDAQPAHLALMWASLAVPDVAADKQFLQNEVKKAINFEGSPIQQYLVSAGVDLGIPAVEDAKGSNKEADAPLTEEQTDDILNDVG